MLEIVLQSGGAVVNFWQERGNIASLKKKGEYRILCVGESTTALWHERAYPRQLEEILNSSAANITFSVINKGICSIGTDDIIAALPDYIKQYDPDMVIAMMGINDDWDLARFDDGLWSRISAVAGKFKTIKLVKWISLHLEQKLSRHANPQDSANGGIIKTLQIYKEIEASDPEFNKIKNYWRRQRYHDLERILRRVIARNPFCCKPYGFLAQCYLKLGRPELAKEYFTKAEKVRRTYYQPMTRKNFLALKKITDEHDIQLVCVQYPLRDVESLKKMLAFDPQIIFVDNERSFIQAVKREGYEEYFTDIFAWDFGHCTDKGNHLLAQNVAQAIVQQGGLASFQ